MNVLRLIVAVAALAFGQMASAQLKILPKEKIDSVANPPLASNAECMVFDCDRKTADYESGDIQPRTFEYGFVNNGNAPIVITRIVSTCSCAVARSDKRVIAPNQRGVISLTYNPERRIGRNIRRVFIYTDENKQPSAVLRLEVTHK